MCDMLQCPELKCPPEQQMSVTDECCKFCQGIVGASQYLRQYYPDPVRVEADGSFWSTSALARHRGPDEDRQEEVLRGEEENDQEDEEEEEEQGTGGQERLFILESGGLRSDSVAIRYGPTDTNGNSNSHESFAQMEVDEVEQDELREASFDTKFVEDRDDR